MQQRITRKRVRKDDLETAAYFLTTLILFIPCLTTTHIRHNDSVQSVYITAAHIVPGPEALVRRPCIFDSFGSTRIGACLIATAARGARKLTGVEGRFGKT